jgi:hypothetical protein
LNDGHTAPEIIAQRVDKRADADRALLYSCLTGERLEPKAYVRRRRRAFHPPHVVSPELSRCAVRCRSIRRAPTVDALKAELPACRRD